MDSSRTVALRARRAVRTLCVFAAVTASALGSHAFAADLVDPMQPAVPVLPPLPGSSLRPGEPASTAAQPVPVVQAVLRNGNDVVVMLDGVALRRGETKGALKLVAVRGGQVDVEFAGMPMTLSLYPGIQAPTAPPAERPTKATAGHAGRATP